MAVQTVDFTHVPAMLNMLGLIQQNTYHMEKCVQHCAMLFTVAAVAFAVHVILNK